MRTYIHRFAGVFQLAFVIAIVGGAIMLSASLEPDASAVRPTAMAERATVSVVEPVRTRYTPSVTLNGVVESRTVTSIIPQVAGRVVEVSPSFRPGAEIASGDILFVIDPSDYELSVDRTLAEIEAARSELARLEAEAAAETEVWEDNFPDRQIPDLIARKPQIAAAKARIKSGEAARAAAELALSRTVVRAPFNGRVLESRLDKGQVVSVNAAVGTVFPVASIEISAPVSAAELRRIGPLDGRPVTITTPAGVVIDGTVVRKAAALDERTRLGTLFIASADPTALTLGDFVTADIEGLATEEAYRLPSQVLTSLDQLWVVDDNQLVDREVSILGRYGDELVVGAFDVADGIVVVPPPDVRVGMPVEPVAVARLTADGGLSSAGE